MHALSLVAALLYLGSPPAIAPVSGDSASRSALATLEDYRRSAGRRLGDTLRVALVVREVRWRPEGPHGAELPAFAFVEEGRAPRVPGPLIRVPAGTVVQVTLSSVILSRVLVYGLQDHAAGRGFDSVAVNPGATQTVTFRATRSGTYHYWGRLRPAIRHPTAPVPDDFVSGEAGEGPFVGALIVDPLGTVPPSNERVLLMTRWLDDTDPRVHGDMGFKVMVNGASWPFTERLRYTVGDTVQWRVINAMGVAHPMHLHGFYFRVMARGDSHLDTLYTAAQERLGVTELLGVGHSMALTWVAERAGNWLFHCHLVRHMAPAQRIGPLQRSYGGAASVKSVDHLAAHGDAHAEASMAGLVLGINVRPRTAASSGDALARATGRDAATPAARRLRVFATTRAGVFGDAPGHAFVLQDGATVPASDSVLFPSSTLVLHRGEPTAITVVNRMRAPLAVHWHGMELESWFDGVGGWSGAGRSVRDPVAPGDSFVVRMTPPRAGTFIYHTHDEAGAELASGLYGPLVVEEPGAPRDTTRDHLVVLGMLGRGSGVVPAINGRRDPAPMHLASGVHRLRLVSIPVDERFEIALVRDSIVQTWRPVARDGADLSESQRAWRSASVMLSAGQTFDVEVMLDSDALAAGAYELRVRTLYYPSAPPRRPTVTVMPLRGRD